MKYGSFIAIILVVLIGLGLLLGKLNQDAYDKGRDDAWDYFLEDTTSSELLDIVRSRDGIYEILEYVHNHDRDVLIEYVCEDYDQEEILDRLHLNYYPIEAR